MSERLQRFRKLMAAFEGTSNPQHAIERGYYVDLPNNPMAEITRRIEVRPASLHLLLGGIGSGKTTQLLLAQEHLNQLEGFNAIYVDVSLHTDISELKQGSLVAIAGLEIIKFLDNKKQGNLVLDQHRNTIYNLAYGRNEVKNSPALSTLKKRERDLHNSLIFPKSSNQNKEINTRNGMDDTIKKSQDLLEISKIISSIEKNNIIHHQGLLSSQKEDNSHILEAFSSISKIAMEKNGEIVFVFDGLDRLGSTNVFVDSVLNDARKILKLGIGLVIVGSIPIIYKKGIENISNHLHYFSYLDISEDVEAEKFFTGILNIRDPDNSITSEAKEFLITQSGGVLRDLMSLSQSAIEEAYVDGSDNVKLEHAEQAIASLARSKFMGLTDANLETLQKIISQKTFIPRTPEDLELLLTGHILEYTYPRKHFAVHPVLIPLIQEENKNLSVTNG